MRVLTYRITLREPTLVTALEGDPNSAVALSYLPGSALRGAIIGQYLRQHRLPELDATHPDMRRLFLEPTTRYLNGYLLDRLETRTLPTLASWQQDKAVTTRQTSERPAPVYDFAIESRDHEDIQWQAVNKPFCRITDDEVYFEQPHRHIAVHTTRTRRFGRAMPQNKINLEKDDIPGAVFRYNALAADQTFEAAILCEHEADAAHLLSLLSGEVRLGGARSSGYGRAELSRAKETAASQWREVGHLPVSDVDTVDNTLIVTFLSDVLLRDQNGQFVVDPRTVTEAISKRLGKVELRLLRAFLRGREVGGFNRKWGMPLPQTLAVEMGSVCVYEAAGCDTHILNELEAQGIGERRAEGFGRIAVNWHMEPEFQVDTNPSSGAVAVTLPVGTDSARLAQRMVQRMLRQQLDERLTAEANQRGASIRQPSNSQLSRLRCVSAIRPANLATSASVRRDGRTFTMAGRRTSLAGASDRGRQQ